MSLLSATGIGYDVGGRRVLDRVDLSVQPGERVAVVGPSGSGKSTLLAILAGLIVPTRGHVTLAGERLRGLAGPSAGVAVVLQGYGLVSLLTAAENVEVALRARGVEPDEARRGARAALDAVGLDGRADHLVEELSGGQQQRVAVARALAVEPRLLIADEPTAELDAAARALVMGRLLEWGTPDCSVILATHDAEVAERCDRVLVIGPVGAGPSA